MLGAIEAGGTKFVCAVGDETGQIIEQIKIPTTVPEETMAEVIRFFKQYDLEAIGIGSFGPIDVNLESSTYGSITSTPKIAWKNFPFVQTMKDAFSVPIGFNTDVNAGGTRGSYTWSCKGVWTAVCTSRLVLELVQGPLFKGSCFKACHIRKWAILSYAAIRMINTKGNARTIMIAWKDLQRALRSKNDGVRKVLT